MVKEKKMMSVVTFPLKTEKWQEDNLDKKLELCRKVYNNMLHYELKQYNKMKMDPVYKEAEEFIFNTYKIDDAKEKAAAKKSTEYKDAVKTCSDIRKEYGISEFGFIQKVGDFREVYKENINSNLAAFTIAKPMWAAFDKCLFGNGKRVNFKRPGDMKSMVSEARTGLRICTADGKTVKEGRIDEPLFVFIKTGKKTMKIPIMLDADKNDTYKKEMLDGRNIKTVRITRKYVKGVYKYYVQLCVEGAPVLRYDKSTGEIRNALGKGKVGIYIDTDSVTICKGENDYKCIDLNFTNPHENRMLELQKMMDTSRRMSNPENYNEDGTIKKGIMVDGQKTRLKWTFSNNYYKARSELKNLHRVVDENRKLERQRIANEILVCGDEFIVNDFPFQWAAMRKEFKEGEEVDEKGRYKNKKKQGKKIGSNAPATLVTLLDQKCVSRGGNPVVKHKIKDIDKSEGYKKYYANMMREML